MQMHSVDVVLVMALVLQHHGPANAVRRAAGQLRDRVFAEHRPKMTAPMRMQDDTAALQVALNIVQRATDALGILAGKPFPARPSPSEGPPDQGTCPPRLVPSPVNRCILPEIIHDAAQRKGLRNRPVIGRERHYLMENITFLTHKEVCEPTGARTKAKQIEVLKKNGIRHTVKANGWPCVITASLLAPATAAKPEQTGWTPRKAG